MMLNVRAEGLDDLGRHLVSRDGEVVLAGHARCGSCAGSIEIAIESLGDPPLRVPWGIAEGNAPRLVRGEHATPPSGVRARPLTYVATDGALGMLATLANVACSAAEHWR